MSEPVKVTAKLVRTSAPAPTFPFLEKWRKRVMLRPVYETLSVGLKRLGKQLGWTIVDEWDLNDPNLLTLGELGRGQVLDTDREATLAALPAVVARKENLIDADFDDDDGDDDEDLDDEDLDDDDLDDDDDGDDDLIDERG